jgi:hypothetical protein
VNAEFFALAFTAALNPKLLALDLLLIENRRPRAMFLCLLLGGMTVALTIGLLDVLVFHADAIKAQGKVSAGVALAPRPAAARRRRAARNRPPARSAQGTSPGRGRGAAEAGEEERLGAAGTQ